jgi:hypothetical protein
MQQLAQDENKPAVLKSNKEGGIHMVIATQRPTKQFLSPNIKAN